MLKKFNKVIEKIITESKVEQYAYADELLEDAYDIIGFNEFLELVKNEDFIQKLNNTNKAVLEDAMESLLKDNIEQYDDDNEKSKIEATKFYNYLKELVLKKDWWKMKINYFDEDDYDEVNFVKSKHTKLKSLKKEEINELKLNTKNRNNKIKKNIKIKHFIQDNNE